ncbi:MAG: hypothetical protein ABII01_03370 [Candidatus Woesearchaeota archaeon]
MIRNKRGYVRTMEVVIAIVITFIFVIYIIPNYSARLSNPKTLYFLSGMYDNKNLSSCVVQKDALCVNNLIADEIPIDYEFSALITDNPNARILDLPDKRIIVDSLMFTGNISHQNMTILKVYYWKK